MAFEARLTIRQGDYRVVYAVDKEERSVTVVKIGHRKDHGGLRMKKRYTGGCHCGAVRFEADIDLSAGTFKCNCSMCTKTRMWGPLKTDAFRLLAGEGDLTDYQPNTVHHLFCRHCGVRSFGWGETPELGRFYVARISCLQDVDVQELVNAPITYFDGANDDYESPPAEIRHL